MKEQAKEQAQLMRTWYRIRYNLPPNDPRYLDLTDADIQLEYWTIRAHLKPPGEAEFDTPDFDEDLAAFMAGEMDDFVPVTQYAAGDEDFEVIDHGG